MKKPLATLPPLIKIGSDHLLLPPQFITDGGKRRATRDWAEWVISLRHLVSWAALVACLVVLAGLGITPTAQAAITGMSAVANGYEFACGLTTAGGVKCWGRNSSGQLGDGTNNPSDNPVDVSGLTSGVSSITTGSAHACAVMSADGSIKCWGNGTDGQLGNSATSSSNVPVDVSSLTGADMVAAGNFSTCAKLSSGAVQCWGLNSVKQLGNGTTTASSIPVNVKADASNALATVSTISVGGSHACAIFNGGGLKCWGNNPNGQIGNATTTAQAYAAQVTGLTANVTAVSAGPDHTCAIVSGGLQCWGAVWAGKLGNASVTNQTSPGAASTANVSSPTAVTTGRGYTCAISGGGAKCWGYNGTGALGNGATSNSTSAVDVTGLTSGVAAIAKAFGDSTCALTSGGEIKCWGDNTYGQLGKSITGGSNYYTTADQAAATGYTVTYHGNGSTGGTVPSDSNLYAQNASVTVRDNTGTLVKAGTTFAGWNTAADGSGTTYAAGDTFNMGTANATLYALWVTTPAFSNLSPASNGFINDSTAGIGYTLSMPASSGSLTFTRTGGTADNDSPQTCNLNGTPLTAGTKALTVGGGMTMADCRLMSMGGLVADAVYTIAFSATNVAGTGTASITGVTYKTDMTGLWVVTYNVNGGSSVAAQIVTAGNATTAPSAPTKSGNVFAGWYSDAGLTSAFDFTPTISANTTLYAKWGDVTTPVLTSVGVLGITSSGTILAGTSDETATGYWIAVANGSTAPTAAEVEAAVTYGGVTIVAGGNAAMTAASAKSFTVGSLSASTAYTIYLIAKNAAGNRSLVSSANFTTSAADITAPTLSSVSAGATGQTTVNLVGTSDEAATGYFVVLSGTGQTAPTATQVKTGQNSSGNTTGVVTSSNDTMLVATSKTFGITELSASTGYTVCFMAEDAAGNKSSVTCKDVTTQAAPVITPPADSGGGTTTPAPTNTTTLPTGGGTATLTGGQSVTVTENGKDGTTINLPPPSTGTGSNGVNVTLPGTGTVGVSSSATNTQLGVTHVTLPGATASVSTVTVDTGSATFTASQSGQAVAGLKNGIVVVSGSNNSQVSVDATGPNATIGVKSADTLIVPTGSSGVSGTKVDLPPPSASGGSAATVNLNMGGQSLTVQSSQANTSMTFQVVNIGGVQTPVLAVTGNAQVSTSGEDKPIVSIAGNVIKSGKGKSGGGSHQVCNTIVQASSDASSDVVHVVTCYIVLEAGSFSAMNGGKNGFAAIKDGIVWAGETAEFDKNGMVTSAYLGSRSGTSDAVGDDMVPGGAKFANADGYKITAFIPRLAGTPLRLNGAKLDESLFGVINKALGVTAQPALPAQSSQGVLNFNFAGQGVQSSQVTHTINSDTASMLPTRRIRVDTSRADGVSISAEGDVDVATGGLVTTFAPSVADPKAFAEKVALALPGSTIELRWNGTWNITGADGTTSYVGRPQWSSRAALPNGATFSNTPDGNVSYSDQGISQMLFPDFADYTSLIATFSAELNDPNLSVLPRMDGTAVATVNGKSYILAPQWNLFKPAAGKPAWWLENGVFYIKNADGTAQGFTVR